jgi:hypothetical protein
MIDSCPKCGRKLLSHIQPTCVWCGAEILDEEYQEHARRKVAVMLAEGLLEPSPRFESMLRGEAQPQRNPQLGALAPRLGNAQLVDSSNGLGDRARANRDDDASDGAAMGTEVDEQAEAIKERFGHLEL